LTKRGEDPQRHPDTGQLVTDGGADARRRSVGFTGARHDPRHRLDNGIHRRLVEIGAVHAEARDARVDEARVERFERGEVELPRSHGAGLHVLDEHVAASGELPEHVSCRFDTQVENHTALPSLLAQRRDRDVARAEGSVVILGGSDAGIRAPPDVTIG
jgi:hypothetical protein